MQFATDELRIDHVTFVCADPPGRSTQFRRWYGFELIAHSGFDAMLRVGNLVVVLRRARDERETQLLAAGGDRVVDVAFRLTRSRPLELPCLEQRDARGLLVSATLPSPLPGLVHTIVDRRDYDEVLLPGWSPASTPLEGQTSHFTHLDHLTLACAAGSMQACRDWYFSELGFVPIADMREDDLVIETEHSGLRLQALEIRGGPEPSFKLTFVEPIAGRFAGQVDTFLAHNGGPGVQHLALSTPDIVGSVARCREAGVVFLSPPQGYYEQLGEFDEVESLAGEYRELQRAGVLLDIDRDHPRQSCLLQIFTEPVLDRPTFFMELISRRENSSFGASNVRALFRAIEVAREREQVRDTENFHTALEARLLELVGGPLCYSSAPELGSAPRELRPVVIVGAGPIGLSLALALARADLPVVVLDDNDRLPTGSRAVAWIKPTLEIWDRLGVGEEVRARGLAWGASKAFFGERQLLATNMQPLAGQKYDDFAINLQQYYVEGVLLAAARKCATIDLRWRSLVTGARPSGEGMIVEVSTPDGPYVLDARYVVDASGSRSLLRRDLAEEAVFRRQEERFLIVDVAVDPSVSLPHERRFWFDPPFHDGRTALMLPQPDHQLRLDFSLGPEVERDAALDPAAVRARVEAMFAWLDFKFDFQLLWSSIYGFSVGALPRAADGRLIFVGDALRSVSPFGARGGNGGIADVNNLAWKLASVLHGRAPEALLDTYVDEQREVVADHLRHIHNTADFMVPDRDRACLRRAALELTCVDPRAGAYLNSGRFCHPPRAVGGSTLTHDAETGWNEPGGLSPGSYFVDGALVRRDRGTPTWLVELLGGPSRSLLAFTLLVFVPPAESHVELGALELEREDLELIIVGGVSPRVDRGLAVDDPYDTLRARYGAHRGAVYLLRPDGFVVARWPRWDSAGLRAAWRRALAIDSPTTSGHADAIGDASNSSASIHDRIYRTLYDGLAGLTAIERERALARAVLALAQELGEGVESVARLERALRGPDRMLDEVSAAQ
jgi:3-(3-hydroxy-phenyl)propionate hydroxylase